MAPPADISEVLQIQKPLPHQHTKDNENYRIA